MTTQDFYVQVMRGVASYLRQELSLRAGYDYRILAAGDNPRTIAVTVQVNPRYLRPIMTMTEQLSMAARLDAGMSLRIVRGRKGTLLLEVPKPPELWFHVRVDMLPPRRGLAASVGINQERRPTTIDFAHPTTPHALIAGATGSGKTNAEQLLAWNLAVRNDPHQVQMILIDVEKRGLRWRQFDRLPHLLHPVVAEEQEARQVLAWLIAEIDRRREQRRSWPRLFIFIDEMQSLTVDGAAAPLARIARMGREYGVHLVGALQNPTSANLGDADLKRNLAVRLVGRVDSATAAHVATGQKQTGAERLTGAGDFLLIQPGAEVQRLTVALLSEADLDRLPRGDNGAQGKLNLEGIGGLDHMLDMCQAAPGNGGSGRGRPPDDIDPAHVAYVLSRWRPAQRDVRDQLGIGYSKVQRVLTFTEHLIRELEGHGLRLMHT